MSVITAVSAAGLAAGLIFTGVPSAGASPSNADITLPSSSVLARRVTTYCGRVPNLIERAEKAQTRISGDADTQGSLAWLNAKKATASTNQHPRVVRRLDRVIARRTKRLAKLPTIESRLEQAQTECASLNRPAASTPTPSASDSSGTNS